MGNAGRYGYSATVFRLAGSEPPTTEADFWALPRAVYDRPEELVEAGWNTLVSPRAARGVGERLLEILSAPPPEVREPVYGDGRAAEAIARELE